MEKEELKKRLETVKEQIKSNSKDAHFADKLIADLLSLDGQLGVEPTFVRIDEKDIAKRLKRPTFEIILTKGGDVAYQTPAGFTVIAPMQYSNLNKSLVEYILANENIESVGLTKEQKDMVETDMAVTVAVLDLPIFMFTDTDFRYEIAKRLNAWLLEKQEQMLKKIDLQDETPEENKKFKESVEFLEEVKKESQSLNKINSNGEDQGQGNGQD